jgi:hypothetical protein
VKHKENEEQITGLEYQLQLLSTWLLQAAAVEQTPYMVVVLHLEVVQEAIELVRLFLLLVALPIQLL